MTWRDPGARVDGRVEARTRSVASGAWSRWLTLDGDTGQSERGAERGGTEPAWVGPSDGVEVRVTSGGKTSERLPAGLSLAMIDPGRGSAGPGRGSALRMETAAFAASGSAGSAPQESGTSGGPGPGLDLGLGLGPADETGAPVLEIPALGATAPQVPAPGTPASKAPVPARPEGGRPSEPARVASSASPSVRGGADTGSAGHRAAGSGSAPRPPITARSEWGADESISPEKPGYLPGGKIKAVIVHHTAESNDYTCAQAPAVVRGVYVYHVKKLGWKDIGYNFLVDKCGRVYEGRKGGVDRPVTGAHAYGFNTETAGVSVLGTYAAVAPSRAAMTSVARVAAWKLGQYGVDPAGTVTLTAGDRGGDHFGRSWAKGARKSFRAIHGHRDGYNTQCPGDAFYRKLAAIRSWAAGPVSGLAVKSIRSGKGSGAGTGTGRAGSTYSAGGGIVVKWSATTPAALITKNELLVDGEVAASVAGSATSAKATLSPGSHKVAVRAVHQSGRTATSAATTVVAE
ncbi:N-acetylmuramoyl-L-alanine amidase [Streptomyces sp. NPDC088116]|uniref:peptidoglycan recognition protein family protein n=1 Tax=Streptomyces sp. NPDC088116 TaxID=3365825 RepID=UPI00380BA484